MSPPRGAGRSGLAAGAAQAVNLELPIVRPLALPEQGEALRWREGPDLPAVAVVMLAGAIGGWLGMGNLAGGARGEEATVALVFVGLGWLMITAALAELVRSVAVVIDGGEVTVTRRQLTGRRRWSEPLGEFEGVAHEDRSRRWFVRNQGLPATGRRGPVSEFVLVLRHRSDRARDVDLFRAQPALSVLRTMHAVRAGKGGADVAECERVARGYRDALVHLCDRLDKPALVASDGGGAARPVPAGSLDLWLEPGAAPAARSAG